MPTTRKNMADISSDQALNGLKIKTDALPNDWYVTLVNPKEGEPGENMTVARFVELLTSKIPNATKDANGLMSKALIPYNGLWTITLKEGEEYDLGGYRYCRAFTVTIPNSGIVGFFVVDLFSNSHLIYGGSPFSEIYGESNKVSLGRKVTAGNVFVCNKLSQTIEIGIV